MSKRAAGRLNLELTAFIRADFSDIPFPHRFFPSFHLTPVFPQCFHSQQARSTREQGFTKSIPKGQFLSEPPRTNPQALFSDTFLPATSPVPQSPINRPSSPNFITPQSVSRRLAILPEAHH